MAHLFPERDQRSSNAKNMFSMFENNVPKFYLFLTRYTGENFYLEKLERSDRPEFAENEQCETVIKIKSDHTTRDITDIIHISHMFI